MKSKEPLTVIDVAREAGVSPSTVSRILNGTVRVSDAKRKSVEKVIERLGFTRNLMARGLKLGRTHTLGIVMPEVTSSFWEVSLKGIEDRLRGSGYAPMLTSGHWDAEQEAQRVEMLLQRQVDGIILLSGRLSVDEIKRFAARRPMAVFGRALETKNAIGAILDNRGGAFEATTHLIELGHRQIAFIAGIPEHPDAAARMIGYRDALEAAGIAYDKKLVVQGDFHETGGFNAMNRLIDSGRGFTAVFAANDQTALGARLALYRRGLRLPDDVSLVGFDDLPVSRYSTPPLTTVHQPVYELGRSLVDAMFDLIEGRPAKLEVPPMQLIVRESTRRRS
ncbi:LacI family DNA-binding transcriptional regulator [Usitatibacter palustris]|uniref:Catabolite control protein A n=1 Tax=Usitatibacter palustris TaxID=2732487 RepID=A0A6M4H393_9PROT|nr:LacI family DNA-binding transcriptional regulator [Usitatibacter palustris]QJR14061.1 Catabolite control protein A [Usitatibacter palustris]